MSERNYWLASDIIRVFATFGVLIVHVVPYHLKNAHEFNNVAWWSLNLIESLSIWAVPGFIMLSGALLLSPNRYDEPLSDFYRKRINRIGIPFLFWVAAYLTWEKWRQGQPLSIDYVVQSIISSNVSWHLFFLFIIVGLYIMTPWVRLWVSRMSSRDELFFIITLFAIIVVGDIINRYLGQWGWNAATRWIPYLGYYMAGHYIVYHAPKKLGIYVLLFTIGFLGNIIGKYIEMRLATGSIGFFYNTYYLSITMIPLAIGLFGIIVILAQSLSVNNLFLRICRLLAPSTLGVYLIHIMIMLELQQRFEISSPSNAGTAILFAISLAIMSIAITYFIGLLPVVRSVVDCHTQKVFSQFNNR